MEFLFAPPDQDLVRRAPDVSGHTEIVGNPNEEEPYRGSGMRISPPGEETQAVEIAVEIVSSKVGGKRLGVATRERSLAV